MKTKTNLNKEKFKQMLGLDHRIDWSAGFCLQITSVISTLASLLPTVLELTVRTPFAQKSESCLCCGSSGAVIEFNVYKKWFCTSEESRTNGYNQSCWITLLVNVLGNYEATKWDIHLCVRRHVGVVMSKTFYFQEWVSMKTLRTQWK